MVPWSQLVDHSILFLHFQRVCEGLLWFPEVKLTIPSCLCIFSVYVNVFYGSMESSWLFHSLFAFSVCMWMSSMVLWSWADHSILSLHFQNVCECLLWFCEVKLTIPSCLCIFSLYVNVFYGSVKLSWPFHPVFAFSVCMWMSSMVLWSWADHSILSLHFQFVCECLLWFCEVKLTIPSCLCIFSMYVNVFYGSMKLSWHSILFVNPQKVGFFFDLRKINLIISPCNLLDSMLFIDLILYTESNNLPLLSRQYVKTFNFCLIYFWSFDKQ